MRIRSPGAAPHSQASLLTVIFFPKDMLCVACVVVWRVYVMQRMQWLGKKGELLQSRSVLSSSGAAHGLEARHRLHMAANLRLPSCAHIVRKRSAISASLSCFRLEQRALYCEGLFTKIDWREGGSQGVVAAITDRVASLAPFAREVELGMLLLLDSRLGAGLYPAS